MRVELAAEHLLSGLAEDDRLRAALARGRSTMLRGVARAA
jgi:hypothetical protein